MSYNIAIWAFFGLIGAAVGAATYGSGANPPSYGSSPPTYGSVPPTYGSAPQTYGSAPPTYGSAPPTYGSAPTSYGSAPTSYGSAPTSYGSAPADSGYNGAQYGNNGAEAELDNLKSQIDSLESRRDAQVFRLRNLVASAGANVEVKNNYIKYVAQQISNEQNIQTKRLDSLAEKIAAIKKLRDVVNQLDNDANYLKDFNQKVRLTDFEDQINKLKLVDLRQDTVIVELSSRASNIADRIDALNVNSNSELRDLILSESKVRDVFNSINRVKATSFSATLSPSNPSPAKVIFNQEFLGVPQFFSLNTVGFKLVRKNNYGSGYPSNYGNNNNGYSNYGNSNNGYPNYGSSNNGYNNGAYSNAAGYSANNRDSTVSYSVASFLFNDFVSLYTFDESSGDWRVDSVDVRGTAIYFEPDLIPTIQG